MDGGGRRLGRGRWMVVGLRWGGDVGGRELGCDSEVRGSLGR